MSCDTQEDPDMRPLHWMLTLLLVGCAAEAPLPSAPDSRPAGDAPAQAPSALPAADGKPAGASPAHGPLPAPWDRLVAEAGQPGAHAPPRHGQAVPLDGGDTGEISIPPEWKDMINIGKLVAGDVTQIQSAYDMVNKILIGAGWIGAPVDPVQQKLDAIQNQLNVIYAAIQGDAFQTRRENIAIVLGNAHSAREGVLEWAHAQQGQTPVPIVRDSPEDTNSRTATNTLSDEAFWWRPYSELTYTQNSNFSDRYAWSNFIPDRAPNDGNGQVWDYRVVLPSFIDAITIRQEVLAAMNATYARTAGFDYLLVPLEKRLIDVYNHMKSGIRCGWEHRFVPGPAVDSYADSIGCGDIYSGLVIASFGESDRSAPPNVPPPPDWAYNTYRQRVETAIGLPELKAFIDQLSWQNYRWRRLYVDGYAVNAGNYGLPLQPASGADSELWSYDPDLRRLKNADGRCLKLDGGQIIESNLCDWADPSINWTFTDSPPHLVHSSGQCAEWTLAGNQLVIDSVAPCDFRNSENISWHKLQPGSGPVANGYRNGLDVFSIDWTGRPEEAYWDSDTGPAWKQAYLPPWNLIGGSPIAAVARTRAHFDVFAADFNGAIVSNWRDTYVDNGAWHSWFNITPKGVVPPGAPISVVSKNINTLDVFAVADDGSVITAWYDSANGGKWSNYSSITPPGVAKPGGGLAAISRGLPNLDVFFVGTDGSVETAWYDWTVDNTWHFDSNVKVMPANQYPFGAPIAAVSRDDQLMDVFAVDKNGAVNTAWFNLWVTQKRWNPQFPVMPAGSALPNTSITAAALNDHHLDVWVLSPNQTIKATWWDQLADNNSWATKHIWELKGGWPINGRPMIAAVDRFLDHEDLFIVWPSGQGTSAWWQAGSPWTSAFTLPLK
jgi:hypothetical protein